MRYAIFSDIHGNLRAWKAIHRDMVELDADVLVCLGDVVGYGPLPEEVLNAIREVTPNFVLGNHDAAAVGLIEPSWFNPDARKVIEWTSNQLSRNSRDFFEEMPLTIESENLLFVHAEIEEPGRFDYIEDEKNALENIKATDHFAVFVGHTHHPCIFDLDEKGRMHRLPDEDCQLVPGHRYIVNVGSVGEPRNPDDIRGRYVIYDSDTRELYFRRIAFDAEGYRQDLAATTLTITPYFLQVVDHYANIEVEEQRAMMIDMRRPATSADYLSRFHQGGATRKLFVPEGALAGTASKPKPVPGQKRSPAPVVLAVLTCLVLVGAIAALVAPSILREREAEFMSRTASSSSGMPPDAAGELEKLETKRGTSEEGADAVPEVVAKGESIALASARRNPAGPDAMANAVPAESANAPPAPVSTPPPAPGLSPEAEQPSVPSTEVLAYWKMDEAGEEEDADDLTGQHPLRQLLPGRAFKSLAPSPVPLNGEPNPSARALGTWVESEASGAFDLRADRSLTMEGWIMTFRARKPIYVAGTSRNDGEPGWRLDLRSGGKAEKSGSMRLQIDDGTDRFSVIAREITFFDPEPHHFAVVWNHHTGNPEMGSLRLYFDGAEVAWEEIPFARLSLIATSPFQIGATGNPPPVAIDEVRVTAAALDPIEFLSLGDGPASVSPIAFMIDTGANAFLYDGADSPAHREGAIPKNHIAWISADAAAEARSRTRTVKCANGEPYALPLAIDMGCETAKPEKEKEAAEEAKKTEEASVVNWSAPVKSAPAGKYEGIFGLRLMDYIHCDASNRHMGLRVRGLEAGTYAVYFTPLAGYGTENTFDFGLGVDKSGDSEKIVSLEHEGMKVFTYEANSAGKKDAGWKVNRNYFRHTVEVTGPRDWIVAIVGRSNARAAIPYMQLVKTDGGSAIPRHAAIEFRFDGGNMGNQAAQTHPRLAKVSRIRSRGFEKDSVKVAKAGSGNHYLTGWVNNNSSRPKDWFEFTFEVALGIQLDGFSMRVGGPQKLFRKVSLHNPTGHQLHEILEGAQTPGQLRWQGAGTLAGTESLAIRLDAGTYVLRIAGYDTNARKDFKIDDIRVDFSNP